MKEIKIITVINAVSPTSMPINEFLLYRRKNYNEKSEIVLTISPLKKEFKELFSDLEIISVAENPIEVVKYLWANSNLLIHMHQPRSAFLIVLITLLLPKRFKRILTVHNNFEKFKIITRLIIILNTCFSRKVTFVSLSSYNSFPKIFKKIFKKKCLPITNGVDINRVNGFLKNKTIRAKNNPKVQLIYIGKLHKQKNHFKLIDILNKLPDNHVLTIVGEGNDRRIIENKIKQLHLTDRVSITGIITREQVYDLLVDSDIFVSTALWEGMPIGVLEAMSCYLPIVLSDIDPHIEIQDKSSESFICDSEDDFIEKILEYSSFSPQKRLELGKANRSIVETYFELANMHKKYDIIYSELDDY